MLFSIVIPTYNRISLLPQALESVWGQTFTDYEIIVVDDGSTDGSAAYVQSLGSRVQSLKQENKGPGTARNLGVSRARGHYLAFLDSDDVWFPWTLQTFAGLIREHDSPAVLGGNLVNFADETELAGVREQPVRANAFADYYSAS